MQSLDESPVAAAEAEAEAIPPTPTGAPLAPAHLLLLFTRPSAFFARNLDLDHQLSLVVTVLVVGISSAIQRVDRSFAGSNGLLAGVAQDDWAGFWIAVLPLSLFSAAGAWFVGGWWYRVRLGFAGDDDVDADEARRVYLYVSLVDSLPHVALTVLLAPFHDGYADLSANSFVYGLGVLPFYFLSCLASYYAVTTCFDVTRPKALVWFLLLPVALFAVLVVMASGLLTYL